jgi:hypothetical protein
MKFPVRVPRFVFHQAECAWNGKTGDAGEIGLPVQATEQVDEPAAEKREDAATGNSSRGNARNRVRVPLQDADVTPKFGPVFRDLLEAL